MRYAESARGRMIVICVRAAAPVVSCVCAKCDKERTFITRPKYICACVQNKRQLRPRAPHQNMALSSHFSSVCAHYCDRRPRDPPTHAARTSLDYLPRIVYVCVYVCWRFNVWRVRSMCVCRRVLLGTHDSNARA